MRVDVHQHIWTRPLLDRLSARETLPLVRNHNGLTLLHCAAEQPYVIDLPGEQIERRASLVAQDELDLALIAISSPIGIEALPRESALELIDAYLDGVAALPREFAAWGPVALDGAEGDEVDRLIAQGCVGISLPAGALAGPDRLDLVGPILERAAAHGVPLFVHPGSARRQRFPEVEFGEPLWWRPLTDYVAQMQAAWLTFAALGRREHPGLDVIFAMLAGCAPLLTERLEARGGPAVDLRDPRIFYESSSYGPAAVDAMARSVGEAQLLFGSDRPVVEPAPTERIARLQTNGTSLFKRSQPPRDPAGSTVRRQT